MIRLSLLILVFVCFLFQHVSVFSRPDDDATARDDLQDLAPESIDFTKRNELTPFEGVVKLPALKCGRRYKLVLSMSTTEAFFVFDEVDTGCSCRQIKVSGEQVADDEVTDAVITFTTPESHFANTVRSRIDFKEKGKSVCHLYLEYSLTSNLHLTPPSVFLEVTDEGFLGRKIPFVCDATINDVECQLSENLKECVDAQVKMEGNGKGYIWVSPADDFFMRSKIVSGVLSLQASEVRTKTTVPVQLHQNPEIDFSPNTVFFVKDREGDFVGTVMMRVNDENDIDDVKIRIDGLEADIEVKKLNDRIARLRVRLGEVDQFGKRSGNFSWVYSLRAISGSVDAKWQR